MKKLSFPAVFTCALFLWGCVSQPVRRQGPPTAEGTPPESEVAAPALVNNAPHSNRVALVLGGAGVASFATVGLLKKLYEEGVEVELLVATGWPALFALANGYLKSIHDLEWFATRLNAKDFERMGAIDFRRDIDPSEALPSIVRNSFPLSLLSQTRVPVIISATNTDLGEPDVFGSGEWKEPLLRTVSVPGLYRKFSADKGTAWIDGIAALGVREAQRRGSATVVAVAMYDDYLTAITSKKEEELIRRVYAAQLRKTTGEAFKLANFSAQIVLKKEPTDFVAKRAAILAGYREGARLVKKLREPAN